MTYEEQLKIEKLNKEIETKIKETVKAEDFINYYIYHTKKETIEHYSLRNDKQLIRLLKFFNYDFSKQKPSKFKGKKAVRSHESYIAGGQKSAETQKQHWNEKTVEEKEAWSIKQKIAHNTPEFKEKISKINKEFQASLSYEERCTINAKKSKLAKSIWASLPLETQNTIMKNRFKNGRCYNSKISKPNTYFANLLTINNIQFKTEFCLDQKRFDFKINDLLIEINPWSTHNSTWAPFECKRGPLNRIYHKAKTETANKYNYKCLHVFDWDDRDKIINLIANNQKVIYGRNCEIKEVSKQAAIDFINKYHLQNYAKDSIRIGLYHNCTLVSIMTFDKPRYNKNYEYELIRYCSSAKIIGGAEKLFKYFIETYNPVSVISYCDLSKFTGETYIRLNFSLLKNPVPSKHWYNPQTKEHYTDNLLRQQGFSRLIHKCDAKEDKNLSTNNNKTLMIEAGFVEIYDCGQATYVWKKVA